MKGKRMKAKVKPAAVKDIKKTAMKTGALFNGKTPQPGAPKRMGKNRR